MGAVTTAHPPTKLLSLLFSYTSTTHSLNNTTVLIIQCVHRVLLQVGVTLAGLAEGMALADRAGLQQKDVMEVSQLY